jgi:hypothetical protein
MTRGPKCECGIRSVVGRIGDSQWFGWFGFGPHSEFHERLDDALASKFTPADFKLPIMKSSLGGCLIARE